MTIFDLLDFTAKKNDEGPPHPLTLHLHDHHLTFWAEYGIGQLQSALLVKPKNADRCERLRHTAKSEQRPGRDDLGRVSLAISCTNENIKYMSV